MIKNTLVEPRGYQSRSKISRLTCRQHIKSSCLTGLGNWKILVSTCVLAVEGGDMMGDVLKTMPAEGCEVVSKEIKESKCVLLA